MLKKALLTLILAGVALQSASSALLAQGADYNAGVPYLFAQDMRQEKPDVQNLRMIRFITTNDFPPFQYAADDKTPRGYNVDLARALCAELGKTCTIQTVAWNELLDWLQKGRADAVIAGHRPTTDLREKVGFSHPYFRIPARFAVLQNSPLTYITSETMRDKTIGVLKGSAHANFLETFFPRSTLKSYDDFSKLAEALQSKEIDALFSDGIRLSQWIGEGQSPCCRMVGEAFFESRYFGEGMAIVVRKQDRELKAIFDYSLAALESRGVLSEIYLRWFPVGIY